MLDFKPIIKSGHYIKKVLSHKEDSAVLHMGRPDGGEYVLRVYNHEVSVYRVITGFRCDCLPEVHIAHMKAGLFVVEEEYIDGISAEEIISAGGRMEAERAASVGQAVAKAAAFLHNKGYIHRDIKAEHVMLTADGRVVLIDLDAAMAIRPDKHNDTRLLGTAMYAAPEQFGLTRSDVRTDIYALGIFLNEMVTGYHPAVIQCREGRLAEIIAKCISMNPQDRYQSAEELIETLRNPAGRKAAKGKTARRAGAILATFVIIAAGAFALIPSGGSQPGQSGAEEPGIELPADDQTVQNTVHNDDAPGNIIVTGGSDADPSEDETQKPDNPDKTDKTDKTGNEPADTDTNKTEKQKTQTSEDTGNSGTTITLPEDYLPLFKEGKRDPVYYNLKTGTQSAPLYTQDGEWVDQTYKVYADKVVGTITGWNSRYGGFTLDSNGAKTGARGYIHAEKDGKHYAIPVIILGEPMSVYSQMPDYSDPGKGYLDPDPGEQPGDPYSISRYYKKGEDHVIYIVLSGVFNDLTPVCVNKYVTMEECRQTGNWPFTVYKLTFNNPDGGYTPFEVSSTYGTHVFRFWEE